MSPKSQGTPHDRSYLPLPEPTNVSYQRLDAQIGSLGSWSPETDSMQKIAGQLPNNCGFFFKKMLVSGLTDINTISNTQIVKQIIDSHV